MRHTTLHAYEEEDACNTACGIHFCHLMLDAQSISPLPLPLPLPLPPHMRRRIHAYAAVRPHMRRRIHAYAAVRPHMRRRIHAYAAVRLIGNLRECA
jgi:hypothetical protein